MSSGDNNKKFLDIADSETKDTVLNCIAERYGITPNEAYSEVVHGEAESLLDYMIEPERSATKIIMARHGF